MTRGFHHPAETFFKNHLHAARSCSRPPKICRLLPSAGSAEALKNLSLLLRHEKGLQHGIEKGHRGGPGETHPKTQAAPSGNGGGSHTLWPSSITGAILACLWFAQGLHSREITEACSFHLCYYQLEPVGSITSRQAYGAGMPAILIICRW